VKWIRHRRFWRDASIAAVVLGACLGGLYAALQSGDFSSVSRRFSGSGDVGHYSTFADVGRTVVQRPEMQVVHDSFGHARFFFTKPVRIAFQEVTEHLAGGQIAEQTRRQLARTFGEQNLQFMTLRSGDLSEAVATHTVDYIVSTAAFFTEREVSERLQPIASLMTDSAHSPSEAAGSVFFTKSDNVSMREPGDIAYRRIAAFYPSSFSGYLIAQRDLMRRGIPVDQALTHVTFYGQDAEQVLQAVLSGHDDAGMLPVCEIERLEKDGRIKAGAVKILGARNAALKGCACSTELYPSYYFAAFEGADTTLTRAISAALFTMTRTEDGMEWVLPVSNRAVYDLFFDLKIGPYAHLAKWTVSRFVREQSRTLAVMGILLAAVVFYIVSLSVLVRRRTKALQAALEERKKMEMQAIASRDHIANLERTGIVGQMSTMIAHELKQPLGAITNFANGLLRRLRRGKFDEETFAQALTEIVDQGSRASQIVDRVRSYAKQQIPELRVADMSVCVERAIETFRRSQRSDARLITRVPPYLWAEIDDWEVELAVHNLLKNAADAVAGIPDRTITLSVRPVDHYWRLAVSDNGPHLTQQDVDRFMLPLVTTKQNGLGLGLSIVSSIVERHKGRFIGIANPDRGVTICMDLPIATAGDGSNDLLFGADMR
jgi:two-component system sensor histidine kinase TtrS